MARAAGYASETPHHLRLWLKLGEEDANNQKNTIYARLFLDVGKIISDKAASYLTNLEGCPRNWQALSWILENCLHKDYGPKSQEIQELIEYVEKIKDKLHGASGHDKDNSESKKEDSKQ